MSGATMTRRRSQMVIATLLMVAVSVTAAQAQSKPRPRQTAASTRQSRSIEVGGYAMFGRVNFTAAESFDAILGTSSGPLIGGGARIGLPWHGLFADVGAWRFHADGERAFVFNNEAIPLGIPVEITVVPFEISLGWQARLRRLPKLIPYAAAGLTSMKYQETSGSSTTAENVDERFAGYHVLGGAEYKVLRWLGVAGEVAWTTVPDAIGESGVSQAFSNTDLGGTTLRVKITIGR
jgi:hypothetical protein